MLFLDELAEFSRASLESLREPLAEGWVQVSRARMTLTFPAQAQLVAAMNPCPCGHWRPQAHARPSACVCAHGQLERYRQRISGPFLDRIDLRVWVEPASFQTLTKGGAAAGEPSEQVAQRVAEARRRQAVRWGPGHLNAHLSWEMARTRLCDLPEVWALLERACRPPFDSSRSLARIAKVAATLADLACRDRAGAQEVEAAIGLCQMGAGEEAQGATV